MKKLVLLILALVIACSALTAGAVQIQKTAPRGKGKALQTAKSERKHLKKKLHKKSLRKKHHRTRAERAV